MIWTRIQYYGIYETILAVLRLFRTLYIFYNYIVLKISALI